MPEILFFPYFGPSRRSDKRVVEIRLDFDGLEEPEFPEEVPEFRDLLLDAGILNEDENFPKTPLLENRRHRYSSLLAQAALLLQRKNGHRVDFFSVSCEAEDSHCIALVEHEHSVVGMASVELSIAMISGKLPQLAENYRRFSKFAREHVLPVETEAIIKAARRRNIPCFQLEREPLNRRFNSSYRVRPNGLLSLGHGAACRILDGTFCVDKAGDMQKALLRNPDQRKALTENLGVPVIRYETGTTSDLKLYHILVINDQVFTIAELADGGMQVINEIHASFSDLAMAICKEAGMAHISISLQSRDISQPFAKPDEGVLDFDLAPDLEQLLASCENGPDLINRAADGLINWLFPEGVVARMPIVAITGTNGKTTTSRMVNHILRQSGHKPGLVSTDGVFLNGKQVSNKDASSFIGHSIALTSKLVDTAVLEAHHRGLAIRGFAFDHCDVAVCLNVTEEHIETGEIESIEQMVEIKRSLLEQASGAAVLFADDPNCVSMLEFIDAERICLVSLQSDVEQLRLLEHGDSACFCVVESVESEDWLVFYDGAQRLPVIPVNQAPATFDGTAKFNISNAMHALAASHLIGVGIDAIHSALSSFIAGQEMTPGRMNVIDDLPFRLVMDFAHNPDGMQKVCEFADLQKVPGRKLIAFAGLSKRTDEINRKSAQAIAGHFDFYFCKDFEPSEPPKRRFTGPFMQQVLIEEGVPRDATTVVTFGKEVVFRILDACEPDDLLLFLVGHHEKNKLPGYIQQYKEERLGRRKPVTLEI